MKEIEMSIKGLAVLAVMLGAPFASAADRSKAAENYVAAVLADAQKDFQRSHAELGLLGSAAPLEVARESRRPVAPRWGLITGLPLADPVGLAASAASAGTLPPAPAR
jgi:ATP-dependent exoDNAse (exonuclease V) alpha subunit